MNTRAVARVLILTLIFGPVASAGKAVGAQGAGDDPAQCGTSAEHANILVSTEDAVLVQQATGDLVEVLSGAQARDHLYELARRHPQRFKTFGAELSSRQGYEPTEEVTVARTITIGVAKQRYRDLELPLAVPASTTAKNSKGKVIFWSWNDGNPATWEGSMYVEKYKTGEWLTLDGQSDISTAQTRAIWAKETGSGKEGGDDLPANRPSPGPGSGGRDIRLAWHPTHIGFGEFNICYASGCAGCAVTCILSGPLWPKCSVACCLGVIVQCAIQEFFK